TAEILGRKLYSTYGKYLVTQKIFLVVFALIFYYLLGPEGVVLGYAISFLPYSVKIYQGFKESKFNPNIIKSHFGFMMNSFSLDLSRTFSNNIDKIIVGPLLGFSLLGNYQLGVQFLSLAGLLPSIVYQYTLPHDASGNSNKKLKKITILASVLLAILGVALAPIVVPALLPKFDKAIQVIQITSLGIIPLSVNLTYFSKLIGMEKNRIILVGSVIYSAVQVLGIIILGKLFGINGVAASLVLASSTEALYLIIIDRFLLKKESI
ncbi:MAG: polysaccharide biosynthesis C-terminal domain-containing protein, partial [Nitrosotalea sp.]